VSRYYSYLNSAQIILESYKGEEPFSSYLKKYFSKQKKFGSKDRKQIAHLCFCYFRMGPTCLTSTEDNRITERIVTGLFICSVTPNEMLHTLKPVWNEKVTLPLIEKLSISIIPLHSVFPFQHELSSGIEFTGFTGSLFVQPDLFLRLRPGMEMMVKQKLQQAAINYKEISNSCLSLPNSTPVDTFIELDKEAVVQDYSSQQAIEVLTEHLSSLATQKLSIWDCCAASGGKSIYLYDLLNGKLDLTVSDIRSSILVNLKKRFDTAGINPYRSCVIDLSIPVRNSFLTSFDLIIADLPCTGSGTWSRTPEQLYYFEPGKIGKYATLQKKILSSVLPFVKKGGYFLYITCSVFKDENENQVEFIIQTSGFKLIGMGIIEGYHLKADTMFAALFRNEL